MTGKPLSSQRVGTPNPCAVQGSTVNEKATRYPITTLVDTESLVVARYRGTGWK